MIGLLFVALIFCGFYVFYHAYPKTMRKIFEKLVLFAKVKCGEFIKSLKEEIKRQKRKNAKYVAPVQIITDWRNTYKEERIS